MKNFEMCVAYRLQSENLQLFYERNSESLLCVKNICEECNSPWYHSINQCVFCGTENYFIWICYKCNKKVSLTNANPHIGGCGHSLLKLCFNKDCVSRKDNKVHKIILKNMKLGLFEKDGSADLVLRYPNNFANVVLKEIIINKQRLSFTISKY